MAPLSQGGVDPFLSARKRNLFAAVPEPSSERRPQPQERPRSPPLPSGGGQDRKAGAGFGHMMHSLTGGLPAREEKEPTLR